MSRLTSVANVKRYLALPTANQDALLDELIPRESLAIERYVGRRFGFAMAMAKRLNGTGTATIVLPEQPVVAVSGLTVNGQVINASPDGLAAGFMFDDTAVYLIGGKFPEGVQNVAAVWSSGYQATENITVPAALGNATVASYGADLYGFAMDAQAVTYTANGSALTLSTAANGPLVGQFSFVDGFFEFNAADSNTPVTLVYAYAPPDIEQACIEMVGLDLKQRDNLGISSKSLAGESVTYEKAGMNKSIKDMLQPYKRMAPG